MDKIVKSLLCLLIVTGSVSCDREGSYASIGPSSWLITNAIVVDGTGEPAFPAAVRIEGDRILAIGTLTSLPGESTIDAKGMVLSPGFIDPHSHADEELTDLLQATSALSQGITTVVVGQDGFSQHPLAEYFSTLEKHPPAINVASLSGHNTLREHVMKKDFKRKASIEEIREMIYLLENDLQHGALGLSTGLEYEPGIYSTTEEVVALAKVTSLLDGRYVSHIRSEDRWFEDAIQEAIYVGETANIPVHISHLKLASKRLLNTANALISNLDSAIENGVQISADLYPYTAWQSTMLVLVPDRDPKNTAEISKALANIAPPENIRFSRFPSNPGYVGKTLKEVAEANNKDAVSMFSTLAKESIEWTEKTGKSGDLIIAGVMEEHDVEALMQWSNTSIGTDASLVDMHPRGRGTYAKVLGSYVRDKKLLSIESAIKKMTSLPAAQLGIKNRGEIKPGAFADLILINPKIIQDYATLENPSELSAGVLAVWVNGQPTFGGEFNTGRFPGRVLRRGDH